MIHAIKKIGEYASKKGETTLLEQLVDDPNDNGKYNTVVFIIFRVNEDEVTYAGIDIEEYTKRKLIKYAYKKGAARGGDLTPTSKVTEFKKTLERIVKPIEKISKNLDENNDDDRILMRISFMLHDIEIMQRILADLEKLTYDGSVVLTIRVDQGESQKYVGDFPRLTSGLLEQFEKSLYFRSSFNKDEKESIGKNNQCYVCSKISDKTYGYAATFAFYTLDKQGFSSGGFKRGDAWKNYPVCPECAFDLEIGKKYIENKLSATFSNLTYFILPKNIFAENEEEAEELFDILGDLEYKRKMSLKDDTITGITGVQNDLLSLMKDYSNYTNFNIMFYDSPKGSSEFRILLYVEDVLPSNMRRIFKAKDEVEKLPLFNNLPGKNNKQFNLRFSFKTIHQFFPTKHFLKTFLEILNNIFTQRKISYDLLVHRYMDVIREKYCNNESIWLDTLKAMEILFFLEKLDLLNREKEGEVTMVIENKGYEEQFKEFFIKYTTFFDTDAKRAVFLVGVLAQKLLNIQAKDRNGATPFRARLNGLKLNEKIIKRLLPEVQNKLEEYDKNYYNKLEVLIAEYLLVSDFSIFSNDEISFYFTVGMNLANKFQFEKKEKGE
ncbi:MAG: TIGR02556 family CRISPR-associated protein [Halanaerobiales bacterium]|nr:TIGR02556 family CRISPR-associated protein [Halanaerobiales bacterium]